MQIDEILSRMGGVQSVARELGIDQAQAAQGAEALIPAILGGFQKRGGPQAAASGSLGDLLGQLGGGSLLDDVLGAQPTNVNRGNDVLGEIFGSKDVSRDVAQGAAARTGLDPALLRKMLPMIAMMVAGYMAKQGAGSQGQAAPDGSGLGGLLGGLLGGGQGSRGSGGGLGGLLDGNGDGNALDDLLRMAGKLNR